MSEFILSAFADEIDMDLNIQMNELTKHNIYHIEMRGVNGRNLVEYSLDEVRKIKEQLDANGFKISSIGSPIGKILITDDFTPHLDLFKHTIEIAKIMESRYIRIFSFYIPKNESPDKYRDEVLKRLKKLVELVEDTGITLLHENEKDVYGDISERCLDILETIDSHCLKAVFDPANFVQCNDEVYPKAYELLKDYIEYIHIKDALYSNHRIVPAGHGDGKIRELVTELYKKKYNGFLSLEPHLGAFEGLDALELDVNIEELPKSGPVQFKMAVKALKQILESLEFA